MVGTQTAGYSTTSVQNSIRIFQIPLPDPSHTPQNAFFIIFLI